VSYRQKQEQAKNAFPQQQQHQGSIIVKKKRDLPIF